MAQEIKADMAQGVMKAEDLAQAGLTQEIEADIAQGVMKAGVLTEAGNQDLTGLQQEIYLAGAAFHAEGFNYLSPSKSHFYCHKRAFFDYTSFPLSC